jgi:DNA-binding transcriptional ArsR family regulator
MLSDPAPFDAKGGPLVHTDIPTRADLEQLLSVRGAACVSIYLPTAPEERGGRDRLEFKNLAAEALEQLTVLGEPMRIKVLDHLREGGASVGELQAALGASQQNLSKHLGILHAAGMVSRTKQGNRTVYAISDPSVFELCDQVCGSLRRQVAELDAILPEPVGRGL